MSETVLPPPASLAVGRRAEPRRRGFPLKARVALIMAVTIAAIALVNYQVLRSIVQPSFEELERKDALRNVARVEKAVAAEIAGIGQSASDWAHWDDTYAYAVGEMPDYADQLTDAAFENLGLNAMYFYDVDGNIVWGQGYDWASGGHFRPASLDPSRETAAQALLAHRLPDGTAEGIVMTDHGPMLVATRAILTSENEGPAHGTLLFGRLVNAESVAAFRERVEADLDIIAINENIPTGLRQIVSDLEEPETVPLVVTEPHVLTIYTTLADLGGRPAMLVRIRTPRDISATGDHSVNLAVASLCVVGLIDVLVMWLLLNYLVLRPVSFLQSHVLEVAATGNLEKRLPEDRGDEFGVLAREYNAMLGSLALARRQIEEQSFRDGMAETAAGALHNVRNALNPMVNRLDGLSQRLREAPGRHLSRAIDEARDPATAPERRTKLLEYLDVTINQLLIEHKAIETDIQGVTDQTVAIGEILDYQDRFAYTTPSRETLQIGAVVQEAVSLLLQQFGTAVKVVVDPSISDAGSVEGHRIGLMQVLHNVLVNAAESIARAGRTDGAIEIFASNGTADGREMLCVAVSDNGAGIEPDRLTAIFERGVTSKGGGRGGLGLHWCANTMNRMGGRLHAVSDGHGRGATFRILLPRRRAS